MISHITRRNVITIWTLVTMLYKLCDAFPSVPSTANWKESRPATVINIRLHRGWNNLIVRSRDLGGRRPLWMLQRRLEQSGLVMHTLVCTHCSAVSKPCTMTWLFMHTVKQDATHLLFTSVACCILQNRCVAQIAETIIEFWKLKTRTYKQ